MLLATSCRILQLQLSQLLYSYIYSYYYLKVGSIAHQDKISVRPTVTTWRRQGAFFIESCRDFLKVALVGFLVAFYGFLVKDVELGEGGEGK